MTSCITGIKISSQRIFSYPNHYKIITEFYEFFMNHGLLAHDELFLNTELVIIFNGKVRVLSKGKEEEEC